MTGFPIWQFAYAWPKHSGLIKHFASFVARSAFGAAASAPITWALVAKIRAK
jgi:hypothetical protein